MKLYPNSLPLFVSNMIAEAFGHVLPVLKLPDMTKKMSFQE